MDENSYRQIIMETTRGDVRPEMEQLDPANDDDRDISIMRQIFFEIP